MCACANIDFGYNHTSDHMEIILADIMHMYQEYISSKSVQLLQTAFLHIDVTRRSVNPISGGTSSAYVNHSLHSSFSQTNHIQPEPFKGPDSVVDS